MILAGIYIHIPFCRSHCSYCDFATGMYESDLAERYVRALCREIPEWDEIESDTALGISLGVIISMNVPFSIQSAKIFHVAKGSGSGVDVVRSKTIPIGE